MGQSYLAARDVCEFKQLRREKLLGLCHSARHLDAVVNLRRGTVEFSPKELRN